MCCNKMALKKPQTTNRTRCALLKLCGLRALGIAAKILLLFQQKIVAKSPTPLFWKRGNAQRKESDAALV
jgi:hypothetical protein